MSLEMYLFIFIHRPRHHQYHGDYPNHHLTSTLLPNLLPTDSSRHFVHHHFDQRLTKINKKGIILLPEIVTDHEEAGTKFFYPIQHAIHTYPD